MSADFGGETAKAECLLRLTEAQEETAAERGGPLHVLALVAGVMCCLAVFVDAFQTIILPRRPTGRYGITRMFLILTWRQWRILASRTKDAKTREQIYSA